MKKLLAMLLAVVLVLSLAACNQTPAPTTPTTPDKTEAPTDGAQDETKGGEEKTPIKIGLTLMSLTTNPVFVDMYERLETMAQENGWEIIGRDLTADTIVSTMENFISAGCNIVIIQANQAAEAVESMLPRFKEAGVTVAIYDDTRFVGKPAVAYSASCDNYNTGYALGKAAAEWANENIDGEVHAGVINRESNEVFKPRAEGIIDALNEYLKNGKVEASFESQPGTAEGGMKAAEDLLSAVPGMNLCVAWNGGSGVGAYEALKGANYQGYLFTCDCSQDEVKALMEGKFLIGSLDLDLGNQIIELVTKTVAYVQNGCQYPDGTTEADQLWTFPTKLVTQDIAADYWLGN